MNLICIKCAHRLPEISEDEFCAACRAESAHLQSLSARIAKLETAVRDALEEMENGLENHWVIEADRILRLALEAA